MNIVYLTYQQIDKQKWDNCVIKSYNGVIYNTSTYLDYMAGNWDGIVLNDYTAVMPLPWRKKFGIQYIYPPAFTQQQGISCLYKEDEETVKAFLEAIPKKFKHIEINLNATNYFKNHSTIERKNYLLDLSCNYIELRKEYSRSASRNIAKAITNKISVVENAPAADIIKLHRNRFKDDIGFKKNDYTNLLSLINVLIKSNNCYCIAATNNSGYLLAGSIYFVFKNRITFIINGNTAESLKNGATHLLMDHSIRNYSGKKFILDFEGSDHPSFAKFYEQYGAMPETYRFIKLNRLPWPIKFLKSNHTVPIL